LSRATPASTAVPPYPQVISTRGARLKRNQARSSTGCSQPRRSDDHRHFNAPVLIESARHGHGSLVRSSGSCRFGRRAASRPPPRSAPPCLECSSSLSQTAPPSTSLLPTGSLAPVLSEDLSCDVPCWLSS